MIDRLHACILLAVACCSGVARGDTVADGDTVVVIVKDAALQKGTELQVRVPNGTRLTVERTRDGWVRTRYPKDGRVHEGWIDASHVAPAIRFDATRSVKLPRDLEQLIRGVVDESLRDRSDWEFAKKKDPAKLLADLKDTIASMKALADGPDNEVRPLAREALTELEWIAKVARAIAQHPEFAGLPRDTTTSSSFGLIGVIPQVNLEEKAIAPEESFKSLLLKLFHSYDEMRAHALRAAKLAQKRCGPSVERGQALGIEFAEPLPFEAKRFFDSAARDPFDAPHILRLTNATGAALTNCIVQVKIVGEKETRHNVHYVEKWPSGQTRTAEYWVGIQLGNASILQATCGAVERVEVSLWCEQFSQEGIVYRCDERAKELLFRDYVDRAKVVGKLSRDVGVFENSYRVDVSFAEVPYLPAGSIKVRIKRNGEWSERSEKIDKWRAGNSRSFDFKDENNKDVKPSEFEVHLEVVHDKYSYSRRFTEKNE